jgi:hypothetical protein
LLHASQGNNSLVTPTMLEKREATDCDVFQDPAVMLIIHVIKQAIDDYNLGKTSKCKDLGQYDNGKIDAKKKARAVVRRSEEARKFIYDGNGLEMLLNVSGLGMVLSVVKLRKMIEDNTSRIFHFEIRAGKPWSRTETFHSSDTPNFEYTLKPVKANRSYSSDGRWSNEDVTA